MTGLVTFNWAQKVGKDCSSRTDRLFVLMTKSLLQEIDFVLTAKFRNARLGKNEARQHPG
jgi:hypothetical protein